MKKVGVLGSGVVGEVLAGGFLKHGYEVMRGSRDPAKLAAWKEKAGAKASVGTFAQAAAFGDLVVLAVKGTAAKEVIDLAGHGALKGKTVLDATNPLDEKGPQQGVLSFFTGPNDSLMERLQKAQPGARFVKAWNSVGHALMVDPNLPSGPPTMFICGDDDAAKAEATQVLRAFGWDAEDIGKVEGARAIEPLCQLWCAPGFLRKQWSHAFKLLKA